MLGLEAKVRQRRLNNYEESRAEYKRLIGAAAWMLFTIDRTPGELMDRARNSRENLLASRRKLSSPVSIVDQIAYLLSPVRERSTLFKVESTRIVLACVANVTLLGVF